MSSRRPASVARARVLAGGTIVSRVLGFVSAAVLAGTALFTHECGARDTFTIANQLPNNIYAHHRWRAVLSASRWCRRSSKRGSAHLDGGEKRSSIAVVTLGIVSFLLTTIVATLLAAPLLVHLYAASTDGRQSRGISRREGIELATAFAYWCLPQIFFYALYSLLGEVLNARRVFGPFTWAPVLNNVVSIAGLRRLHLACSAAADREPDASDWTAGDDRPARRQTPPLGVAAQARHPVRCSGAAAGLRVIARTSAGAASASTASVGWRLSGPSLMILITQLAGIVQSRRELSIAIRRKAHRRPCLQNAWLLFMLPHS